MALKQCRLYLSKQDNIEVRPYWDTAGACFYIKRTQDASVGAIAGEAAAQAAGLKVFERNIDDFHSNETRFGIISKIDLAMGAVKAEFPDSPRLSCSVELDRKQNDLSKFLKEINRVLFMKLEGSQKAMSYQVFVPINCVQNFNNLTFIFKRR